MISTPKTCCPLCGRMTTVVEVVDVSRYAEQVTYACRCGCGVSDMIVRLGKIISVTPRNPEKQPDFPDHRRHEPGYVPRIKEGGMLDPHRRKAQFARNSTKKYFNQLFFKRFT